MANLYNAAYGIDSLEQIAMSDSPVHRLHSMAKLITTVVYIVVVISFSSENISGLISFVSYPVVVTSLARIPYRPLLTRLLTALPFSLIGGISNLASARSTAFYIGNFAVSYGMMSFVSIMLKTFLTVYAVLILIATTSFIDISCQLTLLRVPKILCLQLVMTYRYLSVLISETASMFTAYTLRAANRRGIKAHDMGNFLGQLILRSIDRAERVYQSMKCRGFDGVYYVKKRNFHLSDIIYITLVTVTTVVLRFFNLSLFFGNLAK